jgi:RNase adaptor protein for sRNA GlmZ degradation
LQPSTLAGASMKLVILTGASGSGKTTIAETIEVKSAGQVNVFRFDSIGVPAAEEMIARWGSGEAWQRAMTLHWMDRLSSLSPRNRPVVFEGQMRLSFIREGLQAANLLNARVLLIDCDDETRKLRLGHDRRQPELANQTMMTWAAYLRREAREGGYQALDTSGLSIEAATERVWTVLLNETRFEARS